MPSSWHLHPKEFDIPTLDDLTSRWWKIPSTKIRSVIAVENQYFEFQKYLLASLKASTYSSGYRMPPHRLGLSVRAAFVKNSILSCISMAEAALFAHGEARGYPLPTNSRQCYYSKILEVWKDLWTLNETRNFVHLYRLVEDKVNWKNILEKEKECLSKAEKILDHLQKLKSRYR